LVLIRSGIGEVIYKTDSLLKVEDLYTGGKFKNFATLFNYTQSKTWIYCNHYKITVEFWRIKDFYFGFRKPDGHQLYQFWWSDLENRTSG
jgi:hypothetical protein